MPLLLSIAFGLGFYLCYNALVAPARPAPRRSRAQGRFNDFMARAGVRDDVRPVDFVLLCAASSVALGVVFQLLLGWITVSLAAMGIGALLPAVLYSRRHDRQRATRQAALVEAITQLRDSIRAGYSPTQALLILGQSGPHELRSAFINLHRDITIVGYAAALREWQEELADPLADTLTATLLLTDRIGSDQLTAVLDQLAAATRAELLVQEELRAYQARTVLQARVIAAMPILVLIGIRQVSPL